MMLSQSGRVFVVLGVAISSLAIGGRVARADMITTSLETPNVAISGYAGPYANVTVNRVDSTHATIVFEGTTVGGNTYLFGSNSAVAVNVNATSWALGTLTAANSGSGFTPGPLSNGGSANADGFGAFNQTIDSFDGYTHSSSYISLNITNTSGTWASASDVLTPNAGGYLFAAHIFVAAAPATATAGALVSGYAAHDPAVPEPTSMALWGLGTLGIGVMIRRRKRKLHLAA